MSWARFDDDAYDHPKLLMVSDEAGMLWFRSILWSRKHRTSGRVPANIVPTLTRVRNWKSISRSLVEAKLSPEGAGLWELDGDDFVIHDFADFGPSHDAEVSEKRAEAGRRGAQKRWQADGKLPSVAIGKPMANGWQADGKREWQTDSKAMARARDPVPSRPDPEKKKNNAGAQSGGQADLVLAGLSGSEELVSAGVDLDRLAMTLRADTIGGGWSDKRIVECLPYALDALKLSRRPDENPLAFVVKVVRRVAPPRQLEAALEKANPKRDEPPPPAKRPAVENW